MDAKLHPEEHQPGHVGLGEGTSEVRRAYASRDCLGVAVGLRQPKSQRVWRVYDEAVYELGRQVYKRYQSYAIAQVQGAIRRGEIPPADGMTCADCGGIASVYEHRDYHRHLDVRPVCISCNQSLPPAALDWKRVIGAIEGRDEFYRIPNTEAAILVALLRLEKIRASELESEQA